MADNVFYGSNGQRLLTTGNLSDRGYSSSINPSSQPVTYSTSSSSSHPLYNQGIAGKYENYVPKNYNTDTKDTGSKNKTTTSTATAASSGYDYGAYLAQLQAERQAAAQSAYNNAISRINDAYNQAASSYGNIFNSGKSTLDNSYNNSQNKINTQAQDSMQEAYVNKMLSQKNLSQKLAAQGISGGASESATAGLINNYGNARNGIQKTWNTNLADLENTYNTNLNDLYSAYQSQMAQLANARAQQVNQAEMNLANMLTDSSSGLYQALLSMSPTTLQKALSGAVANQDAYTPIATEATNTVANVNTQQANDMGANATNWTAWKNYLEGAGATDTEKLSHLVNVLNIPVSQAVDIANSAYQFG